VSQARFHTLKVAAIERLTDDAVAITFAVPPELRDAYRFAAGQHVSLVCAAAGDDTRRSYSICAPAGSGTLKVGVKRLPGGVFSGYAIDRLRVGDPVEVMTPSGRFTPELDPGRARHYGAVAAGSGITPILSILATALEVEPASRATLIYANARTSSIMFLEELEDLKNRYLDRFQLVNVLAREPHAVELLSGRLDPERLNAILDALVSGDVDEWYLCGPLDLTSMVADTLAGRGTDPGAIHRELFHAKVAPRRVVPAEAAAGPGAAVEVTLAGRRTAFTLAPEGEPILDALLAVRPDAPYACKGGVCGTCRALLVEGKVEMEQNYALEDPDLAKGFVLACQSHPAADRVVLDFDR
jgi:ring-1,2-phenylacetyl-CoA epoxidase subunit PaaE